MPCVPMFFFPMSYNTMLWIVLYVGGFLDITHDKEITLGFFTLKLCNFQ